MKLERVAIVSMLDAIPWAPIVLGLKAGLEAHGVGVVTANASPSWMHAELVRRFDPHAVLFCLHRQMLPHLAAWRSFLFGGIPFAALCFDDPYDLTTSLAADHLFDLILTPEQCAIETYHARGRRADLLLPTVCDVWHHEPTRSVTQDVDVLSVGGNQWRPRRTWLPMLVRALEANGKTFGEVAGTQRWIVGPELTNALHRSRMTFDLPRDEYTTDNPLRIPCTYAGPRVHIAAACKVPCLLIDPRGGSSATYPQNRTAALHEGVDAILAMLEDPADAAARAAFSLAKFRSEHAPAIRGRQLLELLRTHLYGGRIG